MDIYFRCVVFIVSRILLDVSVFGVLCCVVGSYWFFNLYFKFEEVLECGESIGYGLFFDIRDFLEMF